MEQLLHGVHVHVYTSGSLHCTFVGKQIGSSPCNKKHPLKHVLLKHNKDKLHRIIMQIFSHFVLTVQLLYLCVC